MTVEEFINDLKNIEIEETRDAGGNLEGCYIIFSKWRYDTNWTYSQTFDSKDMMLTAASQFNQDVLNRQHVIVAFVNPNWGQPYFELLNTEDYYDE